MNLLNRLVMGACFAALLSLISCRKYNNESLNIPDITRLNYLFAELRDKPQQFYVTAGTTTTVYGTKGTKLCFYPNSFKDGLGHTISSGKIIIELIEMYEPADLIRNRSTSAHEGAAICNGGQVSINAIEAEKGYTVYADKYSIGFRYNAVAGGPYALYGGSIGVDDSLVSWSRLLNKHAAAITTNPVPDNGGSMPAYRYIFDSCTTFGFVGCQTDFLQKTIKTCYMNIQFPDIFYTQYNTQVYVVFQSAKSVVANTLPSYLAAAKTIAGSVTGPIDVPYKLVLITRRDDKYYYYEEQGLLLPDGNIDHPYIVRAGMSPVTQPQLLMNLNKLSDL